MGGESTGDKAMLKHRGVTHSSSDSSSTMIDGADTEYSYPQSQQQRHPLLEPGLSPVTYDATAAVSARRRSDDNSCGHGGSNRGGTLRKLCAAMFSFLVAGLNISSTGVLIPYVSSYYSLGDTLVSLIFIFALLGYLIAANASGFVQQYAGGKRGVAIIGPLFHVVFCGLASKSPGGFGTFLACVTGINFGTGLLDVSWTSWAGDSSQHQSAPRNECDSEHANKYSTGWRLWWQRQGALNANTVSGLLHAAFSVGSSLGPFLSATLLASPERKWNTWFYVLTGAALVELVVLPLAFWYDNTETYVQAEAISESTSSNSRTPRNSGAQDDRNNTNAPNGVVLSNASESNTHSSSDSLLAHSAVWICAGYLLLYMGTEASISAWIVTFMMRMRGTTTFAASLCSSGFWAGMALGRAILLHGGNEVRQRDLNGRGEEEGRKPQALGPFPRFFRGLATITDRLGGIRRASAAYLIAAILLQVLFAILGEVQGRGTEKETLGLSLLLITLIGVFCGPLFPAAILVQSQLLPPRLRIRGVAFVISVGQVGAALLPFGLGALSEAVGSRGSSGIRVFELAVLVFMTAALGVWFLFPKAPRTGQQLDRGDGEIE